MRHFCVRYLFLFSIFVLQLWGAAATAANRGGSFSNAPIVQMAGVERISGIAEFEIDFGTAKSTINPAAQVGKSLTVPLAADRSITGLIAAAEQTDTGYHVRLVSPLAKLKYSASNRTFYDKTVGDIVQDVLNEAELPNIEIRLNDNYDPRQITIQYQESDFDFISRLLQTSGIHYHVESKESGDTLIFSDTNSAMPRLSSPTLSYSSARSAPAIHSFYRGVSMYSGKVRVNAYDWQRPAFTLQGSAQGSAFTSLETESGPAVLNEQAALNALAKVRLEANTAEAQRCGGTSTIPSMQAGYRFTLAGSSRELNVEYLITSVSHSLKSGRYENTFTCVPASVAYRDSLTTAAPVISGIVSGVVAANPGETKLVNKYGQVRVRFPFRNAANSASDIGDAGWVRVLQMATGSGTSALWLPEVGDEVAVAFEYGNPDRPVVLGGLFNAVKMPPVPLPDDKQKSVLSTTSPTGVRTEIVINSATGKEELLLRSGNHSIIINKEGITTSAPIQSPVSRPAKEASTPTSTPTRLKR